MRRRCPPCRHALGPRQHQQLLLNIIPDSQRPDHGTPPGSASSSSARSSSSQPRSLASCWLCCAAPLSALQARFRAPVSTSSCGRTSSALTCCTLNGLAGPLQHHPARTGLSEAAAELRLGSSECACDSEAREGQFRLLLSCEAALLADGLRDSCSLDQNTTLGLISWSVAADLEAGYLAGARF